MSVQTEEIEIVSRVDGSRTKAKLAKCSCGSEAWHVYIVQDHLHLQCLDCDETYCQGCCDKTLTE